MFVVLGDRIYRGDIIQELDITYNIVLRGSKKEIEVYMEDVFYSFTDAQEKRDENIKKHENGENVNGLFHL